MGDKFALITGTGVGRASALALARAGFSVALSGGRREPLESIASEARRRSL
jgi:NADP-dependent 3-hydroxy acid dehydrogenase YdfG